MNNTFQWETIGLYPIYVRSSDFIRMNDTYLQPNEILDSHDHDFYEFFTVLQGEVVEVCGNSRLTYQSKEGRLVFPSDYHVHRNHSNRLAVLRNISIRADLFESLYTSFGGSQPSDLSRRPDDSCFHLTESAFNQYYQKTSSLFYLYKQPETYRFILQSLCMDMMINIYLPDNSEQAPRWLITLRKVMSKPENFIIGLDQMSELSGKSQPYINRAFRKYFRQTPTEYINSLRLSHASMLLQTTDMTILEISGMCGFENLSWFNRLFKKYFQQTPSEYRSHKKF